MTAVVPKNIRSLKDQRVLEVTWPDGAVDRFPFKFLRCECPCAGCVDEMTNERYLDPDTVPEDVHPAEIGFSGNYALKIKWSDGHSTGLYSWAMLGRLRDQARKTDS
jgi:DUF971 family protein